MAGDMQHQESGHHDFFAPLERPERDTVFHWWTSVVFHHFFRRGRNPRLSYRIQVRRDHWRNEFASDLFICPVYVRNVDCYEFGALVISQCCNVKFVINHYYSFVSDPYTWLFCLEPELNCQYQCISYLTPVKWWKKLTLFPVTESPRSIPSLIFTTCVAQFQLRSCPWICTWHLECIILQTGQVTSLCLDSWRHLS